ncbi:hypothetical protein A4A49_19311 [Nicotiana attenuata]|uniref:Ubiquitin-like protease family profile domain-containing protein n=1 Tax=Nicotiana attenuata TaxID=49451 RepID=A0A314KW41_NICAT|nr:hypothetical protein A4A49_19311 [Nicotiana attenuata]
MGRKHCARRWWRHGQYHSSTQVAAESVASAMYGPSFSLFSDSQSLFSRNPSNSHVESTTENVELEGKKGNNINASSVDETPYQSLPDTNSEPVIGGIPVIDKGKGKVVEDSELGGSRRESVPKTETQPVDVDCSDDSQLKKKKIGVAPKKLKNITPTEDEKQLFDVRGLNFEIEVECTNSQPDSFQVFGTQLPKTQSMHESTGGDFQPTNAEHKQQDNDPDFREMHNDYDQFERGHVGNDLVAIGDSTPKAPSMFGFGGVGREGRATGVNVKNVTASHGVVNDDLCCVPFVNEHDFGLDSNFELSISAIDQITAITQQATYKQSSHDVKKPGPAPLPSGIPTQTRVNIVIESNTAPQASRVDGVGQVNVGASNVNLPSASCRHRGDLLLDSDFEYTDSQLDLIAAITQGGRRNVNQFRNELTTRAVNKSKPDQSVSRSIVHIQTDVETTPAVLHGEGALQLDCGVYVACFAEYIIEDLPILVANFDVDGLRARFGILLWHYGRNKQLHGESSESEAPIAPKKTRGKKRKK